uniref:Uncharacterized protein n=1 Tax=Arundo donax TaxID=35708 RepID=A0A0A9AQR5_ARUDO
MNMIRLVCRPSKCSQ